MPPTKKRKIADESKAQDGTSADEKGVLESEVPQHIDKDSKTEPSEEPQPDLGYVDKGQERKDRFKALQARAVSSLHPTIPERPSTDFYVAKVRSEEPQRSGRRVTTTRDRP